MRRGTFLGSLVGVFATACNFKPGLDSEWGKVREVDDKQVRIRSFRGVRIFGAQAGSRAN